MENDNLVMYIVVRSSLNMSSGKIAAQVGHAVGLIYKKSYENRENLPVKMIDNFDDWEDSDYRKVVLAADENEWVKLKSEKNIFIITDLGLTEIPAQSETVIGFWPMYQSTRPKILKRLQLLK